MPKRKTHQSIGALTGAGAALVAARDQQPPHQVIEVLAAGISGWYSSLIPDIIDPAMSPNHRSIGHGAVQGIAGLKVALDKIPSAQGQLRAQAQEFAQRRQHVRPGGEDPWPIWCLEAAELLCRMLSGVLIGLVAGYGSHLVLDARTPRGLPLLA